MVAQPDNKGTDELLYELRASQAEQRAREARRKLLDPIAASIAHALAQKLAGQQRLADADFAAQVSDGLDHEIASQRASQPKDGRGLFAFLRRRK